MIDLNKTSTTSILAVIVTVGAMAYFFVSHFFQSAASETTDTQITQGIFNVLCIILGYYYGTSKNRGQNGTTVQQADEVNVTNKNPADKVD